MKKAQTNFGVVIIVMAGLLLLGGMFFDDSPGKSKSIYLDSKNKVNENGYVIDGYLEEDYLFYMNETVIGKRKKVTQSFPNIELGSQTTFNTVFLGNSFRLNSNPFRANKQTLTVALSEPENVQNLLLYFNPQRNGNEKPLTITANGNFVSNNMARSSDVPIKINTNQRAPELMNITFQLEKPKIYELFSWGSLDIEELRVVETIKNNQANSKTFHFEIAKKDLDDVFLDLSISCDETIKVGEPIKATINGFIIVNKNPDCSKRFNTFTANVSKNILNNGKNELVLETTGYYKVAYGLTKVFFNDQEVYKFNINSFNDIIDVVMYGDFDKEVVDLRLNSQTMTLRRDEIKSIIPYLKFGTNEIKFITKPLEIEEFVIEKNEFIY